MNKQNNKLWKIPRGIIMAYTEDPRIIRNIQRTKRRSERWKIFAQYYKNGKRIGVQYKIPRTDRQQAEKVFSVKVN